MHEKNWRRILVTHIARPENTKRRTDRTPPIKVKETDTRLIDAGKKKGPQTAQFESRCKTSL